MRTTTTKVNILFILSGSLRRDGAGVWHTTMWGDVSEYPVLGDRLRIEAGAAFWKQHPETHIVVLGGCGTLCVAGAPAISGVMKRELIELGVPADVIAEESQSGTTTEQVRWISENWKVKSEKFACVILSNDYHLPRVQAMLERDHLLQKLFVCGEVVLLSAEAVLLHYKPLQWKKMLNEAAASSRMQEIVTSEKQGVEQIKNGTYKFN